jgi:shikimate 5-dehydrogenase
MFVEQASEQFQLFTGVSAPRQAMERAAVEALATHHHHHRGDCE